MKKIVQLILIIGIYITSAASFAAEHTNYVNLLKEMFAKVTVNKDIKAIPVYYHPNFMLYTNGETMDYAAFVASHAKIYKTKIEYSMRYDEDTWVEQGDKIAGKVYITTKLPSQPTTEIEVILIAEYKENKLYKLWELTYPDWSKMNAFKNV